MAFSQGCKLKGIGKGDLLLLGKAALPFSAGDFLELSSLLGFLLSPVCFSVETGTLPCNPYHDEHSHTQNQNKFRELDLAVLGKPVHDRKSNIQRESDGLHSMFASQGTIQGQLPDIEGLILIIS